MAMLPDTLHAYIFNIAFPHGLLRDSTLWCGNHKTCVQKKDE